jgi:hypothetical protein
MTTSKNRIAGVRRTWGALQQLDPLPLDWISLTLSSMMTIASRSCPSNRERSWTSEQTMDYFSLWQPIITKTR